MTEARPSPRRVARTIAAWLLVYAFMVGVAHWLRMPASDWYVHFLPRYDLDDYPPLIYALLAVLPSLPFLSGLTLTALLFALWRRGARWEHVLAAFTAMPLYWTLWLGQVDAVPMLGLTFLPWGIPLVLLKPQVALWYTWAWWRQQPKKWPIALGAVGFGLLTLAIWGLWPLRYKAPWTLLSVYNLSLWVTWWPLAVLALVGAALERDPDRAMALGALAVPYLQGCSYIVLLPVLVRLRGWRLALAWLTTWTAALALIWGDAARPLAALFPATLWLLLTWEAYRMRERERALVGVA